MKLFWTITLALGLAALPGWGDETTAASSSVGGSNNVLIREVVDAILPSGVYNVVTYDAPRAVRISDLGLREAGLTGGDFFPYADEIRIFASRNEMEQSPKARLWFNNREGGKLWYHTGGRGSAEDFVLQPGEVLIVYTRVSKSPITWQNPLR